MANYGILNALTQCLVLHLENTFFFFLDVFIRSIWYANGEIQCTVLSIHDDESSLLARYFGAWSSSRLDSIDLWKFACFVAFSEMFALLWSNSNLLSISFCRCFKICMFCCTNGLLATSSSSTDRATRRILHNLASESVATQHRTFSYTLFLITSFDE